MIRFSRESFLGCLEIILLGIALLIEMIARFFFLRWLQIPGLQDSKGVFDSKAYSLAFLTKGARWGPKHVLS